MTLVNDISDHIIGLGLVESRIVVRIMLMCHFFVKLSLLKQGKTL
jgi:hypothetical protein